VKASVIWSVNTKVFFSIESLLTNSRSNFDSENTNHHLRCPEFHLDQVAFLPTPVWRIFSHLALIDPEPRMRFLGCVEPLVCFLLQGTSEGMQLVRSHFLHCSSLPEIIRLFLSRCKCANPRDSICVSRRSRSDLLSRRNEEGSRRVSPSNLAPVDE